LLKTGYRLGRYGSLISVITVSIQNILFWLAFIFLTEGGTQLEVLEFLGWEFLPFTLPFTLIIGVISFQAAKRAKNNSKIGFILLIICGILLGIGVNIYIAPGRFVAEAGLLMIPTWFPPVPLINTLLYFEPYLITLGGVMGLLSIEEGPIISKKAMKKINKKEKKLMEEMEKIKKMKNEFE